MRAKVWLFLFLSAVTVAAVHGHPHIFYESSFTFHCTEDGLKGFDVKWVFDEIFSASILMEFDLNKNKTFERQEIKTIEENAFSNLKNFNYFVHVWVNSVKQKISAVKYFSADYTNNRLIYRFYVPFTVPVANQEVKIEVGSYDDTFFCAAENSSNTPVRFSHPEAIQCSWKFVKNKKNAYWGGSIIPETIELSLGKKR